MAQKARVTIEGDAALFAKLKHLDEAVMKNVAEALQRSAENVRNRAVMGIAKGPKTGRVYTHRFPSVFAGGRMRAVDKRARPHTASAPGEYPAADTGNLQNSIFTDEFVEEGVHMKAEVWADAEYAKPLEYKPVWKGGRPFLRRALMEESGPALTNVTQAVLDAIREVATPLPVNPYTLPGPAPVRQLTGPRPPRRLTGPSAPPRPQLPPPVGKIDPKPKG
jgi:hypothetical protein